MSKKNYWFAVATVMSIFAMGQIPGSIDAAINEIAVAFHVSTTTGLYVTTVASLMSVVFSLIVGIFAGRKVGYRTIVITCAAIELVGSLIPFFATNFIMVLFMRAVFGVGFGGIMGLENTMATLIIPEAKRPAVLGMSMFCGFGANCLLQFTGGILANIGWNYVFLTHLFLIIPFVIIVLYCPKVEYEAEKSKESKGLDELKETDESEQVKVRCEMDGKESQTRIHPTVIGMSIVMMVVGMMISPLMIGCSFLSVNIMNSTVVAGIVAVCFSVGCMVGGLFFSVMYKIFRQYCTAIFLLIAAIGMVGCAVTKSILGLCVLIFIGGVGFSLTQSSVMMLIGLLTSKKTVAIASALMMSLFNLGMFLSSLFENLIAEFTGDALYAPLYIGAAIYGVIAMLLMIKCPFPQKTGPS